MKRAAEYPVASILQYKREDKVFRKIITKVAEDQWITVSVFMDTMSYVSDGWVDTMILTGNVTEIWDNGKVEA